jgi:hypothetical protein
MEQILNQCSRTKFEEIPAPPDCAEACKEPLAVSAAGDLSDNCVSCINHYAILMSYRIEYGRAKGTRKPRAISRKTGIEGWSRARQIRPAR